MQNDDPFKEDLDLLTLNHICADMVEEFSEEEYDDLASYRKSSRKSGSKGKSKRKGKRGKQ